MQLNTSDLGLEQLPLLETEAYADVGWSGASADAAEGELAGGAAGYGELVGVA